MLKEISGNVKEWNTDLDEARYQFDVNLFGLARLTKLVLPHMRQKKSGKIVNISSMGGKIYTPLGAWYHASKHALEGWSDCLRFELKPFNMARPLIFVRQYLGDRVFDRVASMMLR